MKKTLTINLGGTVYHIDEDAYHLCVPCICRTHPESFSNSSKIQI